MGKKFADYAAERAQQASPEESAWVAAFDAAYAKRAVGAALATARKARHLNQTELAARTGMSQGDISKIERGVVARTPSELSRRSLSQPRRLLSRPRTSRPRFRARRNSSRSPWPDLASSSRQSMTALFGNARRLSSRHTSDHRRRRGTTILS